MSRVCKREKEKSREKSNQLFDRRNVFLEEKKFWRFGEKKKGKKERKKHRIKHIA